MPGPDGYLHINDVVPDAYTSVGPVAASALQGTAGAQAGVTLLEHRTPPVAGISMRLPLESRKADFKAAMLGLDVEDDADHPFWKRGYHLQLRVRKKTGVPTPPWSCTSPSPTMTLSWYYFTCTPIGGGLPSFTVNGPIETTLRYSRDFSIFHFMSDVIKLPADAYASCSFLVGGGSDDERCKYVRFVGGCLDPRISPDPGISVLIYTNPEGFDPGGSSSCNNPYTPGGLVYISGTSPPDPYSILYGPSRTVFPLIAHGILTL